MTHVENTRGRCVSFCVRMCAWFCLNENRVRREGSEGAFSTFFAFRPRRLDEGGACAQEGAAEGPRSKGEWSSAWEKEKWRDFDKISSRELGFSMLGKELQSSVKHVLLNSHSRTVP